MTCEFPVPEYLPHSEGGILVASSMSDGYSVRISWQEAFVTSNIYNLAYNIYYSTSKNDIFAEGVKFVSTGLVTDIVELTPGDTYYFAVRATQFDSSLVDLTLLPDTGDSKFYPEGALLANISESASSISVSDISYFPNYGVIQIGGELIVYSNKDLPTNSLTGLTRGYLNSNIRYHNTDGYDGYYFQDPLVKFWKGMEEPNEVIFQEAAMFDYPIYPATTADGYYSINEDTLTTELGGVEESFGGTSVGDGGTTTASQEALPPYDYAGWHRTDIIALLRGDCLDTYYGGEQYCADGYSGVGRQIRGVSIADESARRQEMLLEATGEPVVLFKRTWTGIKCKCYVAHNENPDDRCPVCFGTGFVVGYNQYYNPRRSDGRIMVRFSPTEDDLKVDESGLEPNFITDAWTMVTPAIKDKDFIIRYNDDDSREFRYEVLSVNRNKLLLNTYGKQTLKIQRVRKTDPIYQVRAVDSTATVPTVLTTSLNSVGSLILPHYHTIVVSNTVVDLSQINGVTSIVNGHNHVVTNGILSQNELDHTHTILL